MKKLYFLLLVTIVTQAFADTDYFLKDQNNVNLKVCKKYFTDEQFVKTVNLLNEYQMILRNVPDTLDKDGNYPYSQLVYTLIDCFLESKYLIMDEFMPDSHSYFAIDLHDGVIKNIDGIPMLSPDRKHFLTIYSEDETDLKLSIYSLKGNKIEKIFTTNFDFRPCRIDNTKWVDDKKISFDIACEYDGAKTKAFIEYSNKKWQYSEELVKFSVDEFIPTHSYLTIDLCDSVMKSTNCLTMLSPDRKHSLAMYSEDGTNPQLRISSLKNNKNEKVFTTSLTFGTCRIENTKWVDDKKISFDIACDYDNTRTKAYIEYYNKKWQYIELVRPKNTRVNK